MKIYRLNIVILFLLVFSNSVHATEEDYFPSNTVIIDGGSHQQTGAVSASLKIEYGKITSFHAGAFGKKFELSKKDLLTLSAYSFLGVNITHSAGPKRGGGHSVNFKFIKAKGYNNTSSKTEYAIVFVSEFNGINIFEHSR